MKGAFVLVTMLAVSGCSGGGLPARWSGLPVPEAGLVAVEDGTDQNGLYLEYRGWTVEQLFESVSHSLEAAGYVRTRSVLEGRVLGFEKNQERLAVKVDQFGSSLYVSIFNEAGKDPLLHGVVFGKYTLGETVTGDRAKEMFIREIEER